MGDPKSTQLKNDITLRHKFELEKRRFSYTDIHREDVKNRLNMAASQKRTVGNKDEIIRHMSNLPNFVEMGKATPDRALSFGVMEWGRLEKWQYQNVKCSPSSSNSSPLFSTERSTPRSTKSQTCYPSGQTPHRVTLQSYFNKISHLGNVDKFQDCKMSDSCPPKIQESESLIDKGNRMRKSTALNEKTKIQDLSYKTRGHAHLERQKTVSLLPTNCYKNSETSAKRSSFSSKNSNLDMGTVTATKPRNMSPIRRFSFGVNSKSTASTSATDNTPRNMSPIRRFSFGVNSKSTASTSATDNTPVSNRSRASPLRRLLEPLIPLKATNSRQSIEKPQKTRAIFQTTVKNSRLLFTFAVENNSNIVAATVTKGNSNRWIYTFFTADEVKKKNGSRLSHNKKEKGHGYVPNMTSQMTVTNRLDSDSDIREFSLFRADPYDELAAIVVKFSRIVEEESFRMTVILPGGNHGVSSNGKPSPLIERWGSGGVCDCGGWDLGCRLRTLTNQVQSSTRSKSTNDQFDLFFQGDVVTERRFFRLCTLKEGTYSVEYNSSLSPLQALSICLSVVECRKSCQNITEHRTYVAKQVQDDPVPVRFASFPPLSPVGRV